MQEQSTAITTVISLILLVNTKEIAYRQESTEQHRLFTRLLVSKFKRYSKLQFVNMIPELLIIALEIYCKKVNVVRRLKRFRSWPRVPRASGGCSMGLGFQILLLSDIEVSAVA
ncbi:hypothetical protein NPIL_690241 [Nephila pilipes]|uniref:Uncharacterized protein n=1 Tax=Nephila pilipes TaxID=299642 RepID=A0A8X6NUX2_NEPPI|nr:hypothetical protein NPIL_690241 [Nephila pilipes]